MFTQIFNYWWLQWEPMPIMHKDGGKNKSAIEIIKIIFTRTTNHQQMHKESFIINRNTLLHVLTQQGWNM
jgi:hypothetical protein